MSKLMRNFILFAAICWLLNACTANSEVPVTEGWHQPIHSTIYYTVQPGDTLYSIAWNAGVDYRQIASVNHLAAPSYPVHVGQNLILSPSAYQSMALPATISTPTSAPTAMPQPTTTTPTISSTPVTSTHSAAATPPATVSPVGVTTTTSPAAASAVPASSNNNVVASGVVTTCSQRYQKLVSVKTVTNGGVTWAWPAQGRIIDNFSATGLDKGIDIIGKAASPVLAAANGTVVYAGNGLHGYGNLVIIKHNDEFLSAYAHNQCLLVHEGQTIRVGQVIALMGNTDATQVMLHFEIRKAGKPVQPLDYLPAH